ncbi:MAG: ABC-type multidrug transport system fused ATPase/permease subunit, partial [Glaciecola sp.]
MRPSRFNDPEDAPVNWRVLIKLWPYLTEFKTRVWLAIGCLVAAKVASVALPFILKDTVDNLNLNTTKEVIMAATLGLIIAYGVLRLA